MKIRRLNQNDVLENSFFQTLSHLSPIDLIHNADKIKIFYDCEKRGIEIYVAILDNLVVGTIRIIFETKFYHQGKTVAHIEDLAIHPRYIKQGVAEGLMKYATNRCVEQGAYKIILNCSDDLLAFYQKLGFQVNAHSLSLGL